MFKVKKAIETMPTNLIKAVIYARVSSAEQEKEGYSIAAQLKLLRDYATGKGMEIIEEFVDIETAKQAGRTEFGKMVGLLTKHVAKSDRCRTIPWKKPIDYIVTFETGSPSMISISKSIS